MDKLDFDKPETASDAEEEEFFKKFIKALAEGDDSEARRHLAAGRAIYVGDENFPDAVVKLYPDGRLELVTFTDDQEVLIRPLDASELCDSTLP